MGDRLKGKVAIVTGAGSVPGPPDREPVGNGRAAAIVYAEEGAAVMAVDMEAAAAEETKRKIRENGGICSVFEGDVTRADDCYAMARRCIEDHGRIDILHNNVGIVPKNPGGILEAEEADWEWVMNTNLKSLFHTCRAVIPHMLEQGRGCILNISSVAAVRHGNPKVFIYSVSKAAVNTFTKCLAAEMADKGIRVNAIMPGMMDTPTIYRTLPRFYGGDIEAMRKDRDERVPMKRMGGPWDVANAALFLVSDEASYITGQILAVDGGIMSLAG